MPKFGPRVAEVFAQEVNGLFSQGRLSWQLRDGLVARAYPQQISQAIEEAGALLQNPRFRGPDEQFTKTRKHLSDRPTPDTETCVKDAVGAVKGVTRIIARDDKALSSDLLKRKPQATTIPVLLRSALEKVYAYRGDAPGIGHGQVGPSVVDVEEAEWVLTVCAASIVYLVKKNVGIENEASIS